MTDHYGFETISTELDDTILRITLNRPDKLNSVNALMHEELRDLFARLGGDSSFEVAVITGAGKAFCAGGDFEQMEENNADGGSGYDDGFSSLLVDSVAMAKNILRVRQPLIAAVNGDAIGLGATLALFCDIVYMADTARIGDPHVQAGLVAADGGVVLWPLLLGVNRAKEYLMLGDLVKGPDAERIGLVNHCVPAEELGDTVEATARRLANGAALAIRFNKRLVNKELEERVDRIYETALAMEAITFMSGDHLEAVAAFSERRRPRFSRDHR